MRGVWPGSPAVVLVSIARRNSAAEVPSNVVRALPIDARKWASLEPTAANGLRETSQCMVDKVTTVPRARLGQIVGRLDRADLIRIERALLVFLGLAG